MNLSNVIFSVSSDNQPSKIYKANNVKTQGEMVRITFIGDEGDGLYTFTVINKSKISLACKGLLSYSFPLEKGKTSKFIINALSGEIIAEAFCSKLNISILNGKILVDGSYKLNVGGNITKMRLTIKGDL